MVYCKDDFGGTGLKTLDSVVIFEALGTGCVSTSTYLTLHNTCSWIIDTYGSQALREKYLPVMAPMDASILVWSCIASPYLIIYFQQQFGSYCLTEPNSGSDAASLLTTAVKKGDSYILNGTKVYHFWPYKHRIQFKNLILWQSLNFRHSFLVLANLKSTSFWPVLVAQVQKVSPVLS